MKSIIFTMVLLVCCTYAKSYAQLIDTTSYEAKIKLMEDFNAKSHYFDIKLDSATKEMVHRISYDDVLELVEKSEVAHQETVVHYKKEREIAERMRAEARARKHANDAEEARKLKSAWENEAYSVNKAKTALEYNMYGPQATAVLEMIVAEYERDGGDNE